MKSIISLFHIIVGFFVISCNESPKEKEVEIVHMGLSQISPDSINILIDNSILKGDTLSYDAIRAHYFIRNMYPDFLNYSLLMANKFKYNKACYDVYFILTHSRWGLQVANLDPTTQKIALSYLFKAYKLGSSDAVWEIKNLKEQNILLTDSIIYQQCW